ncbi:MAG TPA: DUF1232 domain-containing protein, partial [Syntrophomonadaceae bacterium]|nr:DUF1232 domain-containing protein [Syntrophomonadaceae bacterium]
EEGKKTEWADFLMLAPDLFHLLCKLAIDPEVPAAEKAKLAGAIVYFIFPVDLLPEALIGPLGYADDIAVAAWVLNNMLNRLDQEIIIRHWAGEGQILELLQNIIAQADRMIGSGLWAKIKRRFS